MAAVMCSTGNDDNMTKPRKQGERHRTPLYNAARSNNWHNKKILPITPNGSAMAVTRRSASARLTRKALRAFFNGLWAKMTIKTPRFPRIPTPDATVAIVRYGSAVHGYFATKCLPPIKWYPLSLAWTVAAFAATEKLAFACEKFILWNETEDIFHKRDSVKAACVCAIVPVMFQMSVFGFYSRAKSRLGKLSLT